MWVVGSLNVDLSVEVAHHPAPGETVLGGPVVTAFGGKGANQAVAAARAGAHVRMLGRVGDDAEGRDYVRRLRAFGIDATGIGTDSGVPTGRALIAVADGGENTIIVSPGANAAVDASDLRPLEEVRAGDVVVVQAEIPAPTIDAAVAAVRAVGARVVLNLAPMQAVAQATLDAADPLVVNDSESAQLEALHLTAHTVLVTHGAEGAEWDGVHVLATRADRVVDTTGAGDTYVGALAAALADGADRADAMRRAADAASVSVGWAGAQPQLHGVTLR